MLQSSRQSSTAPSLSISIPPTPPALSSVGRNGDGANAAERHGSSSVSFVSRGDADAASDQSSICNSPSWDHYNRKTEKKKKKKEKNNQNGMTIVGSVLRKDKQKARAGKEPGIVGKKSPTRPAKAALRRSTQAAVQPVPIPAHGNISQSSTDGPANGVLGTIVKTTELHVDSTSPSGQGHYAVDAGKCGAGSLAAAASPPTPVAIELRNTSFVGGIRLEREMEAAARATVAAHPRRGSLSLFPSVRLANPLSHSAVNSTRLRTAAGPGQADGGCPAGSHISGSMTVADIPASTLGLEGHDTYPSRLSGSGFGHPAESPRQLTSSGHARNHSLLSATATKFFRQRQAKNGRHPAALRGNEALPRRPSLRRTADGFLGEEAIEAQQTCQHSEAEPLPGYQHQGSQQAHSHPNLAPAPSSAVPASPVTQYQLWQNRLSGVPLGSALPILPDQQPVAGQPPGFTNATQLPARGREYLNPRSREQDGSDASASAASYTAREYPQFGTPNAGHGIRDTTDHQSGPDPGRSFRDKALAVWHRSSLPAPVPSPQDQVPSPLGAVIKCPLNPSDTAPPFHIPDENQPLEGHSREVAPSGHEAQTSGTSSPSFFDDSYASSPATTPGTSRPQSSRDPAGVVADAARGTTRGPVVADDTKVFRHPQAAVAAVARPSMTGHMRPRRSSSSYPQPAAGHSQQFPLDKQRAAPFAEPQPGALTPAAAAQLHAYAMDLDMGTSVSETSFFAAGLRPPAEQEQAEDLAAAAAAGPVSPDVDVGATWQSIVALRGQDSSDSRGPASQEEADDASVGAMSSLPPLKHEPLIPPMSRARKTGALPRAGGSTHAEALEAPSGPARSSVAVDQPSSIVSGAAYLEEARRSMLMASPAFLSQSRAHTPPKSCRASSLGAASGPARETALPLNAALPSKPMAVVTAAPRGLSAQSVTLPTGGASTMPQLQEHKQQAVTFSRRSLVPSPSDTAAASRFRVPDREGRRADRVGQKIVKMLVECCSCGFFHDMPSRVYECMANPNAVVEDHFIGISGAITTMVKCPWCSHNMSTACCAGYAVIIDMKERLH